jgi:PhnB protein
MRLNTYLNFGGNCAEALKFYETELGGKIGMISTYDQVPGATGLKPEMAKAVLHARITIGETALMASDVPPERFQPARSVYLCLSLESDSEAERVFRVLSGGGEVFLEMQETFFATRFAQLRDRFGVLWMIIHEKPMPNQA